MTLLATFQTLLYRYTGRRHPSGLTIANRNRSEIEGLIGFSSSVCWTDLSGNPTFRELLIRREVALGAYAHQTYPREACGVQAATLLQTHCSQVVFAVTDAGTYSCLDWR